MPKHNAETEQKQIWNMKPRELFNPMCSLVEICTLTVIPLLRNGLGSRALSRGIFTLVFMFWYGAVFRCPYILVYIPIWLGMVAFRRITADRRAHSLYQGYPWLMCMIPFVNEYRGRVLEFCFMFIAGLCVYNASPALAQFLVGVAAALMVMLMIEQASLDARRRQINDAKAQAWQWAELERGGDGWN